MALSLSQNPLSCFPEGVLKESPNGKVWWVARTKPKKEKVLAWYLYSHQIGYFLPLFKKRQPSENRHRYSLLPLYPSYIFFMADLQGRYQALKSNEIVEILEVKDQERLISELQNIDMALKANYVPYPCSSHEVGDEVTISRGPLKGIRGIVVRKDKATRLVLKITSIDLACYINISEDMVM